MIKRKVKKEFSIISGSKKYILEKGDLIEIYPDVSQGLTVPSPIEFDYLTLIKNIGPTDLPDGSGGYMKRGRYQFTYGPRDSYRLGDTIITDRDFMFMSSNGYFAEY